MPMLSPAPDWRVSEWLNSEPLALADLRGRVVMVCAFQMLCPGCVSHGLPQAQRAAALFDPADVAVVGLHSVFEHHHAQGPAALRAFLHENRIGFPVAVDEPDGLGLPHTMQLYGLQGTPTTILIDREGRRRRQKLGHLPDLQLGAEIMALVAEPSAPLRGDPAADGGVCTPDGCG